MTEKKIIPSFSSYKQDCDNLAKAMKAINLIASRVSILFTGITSAGKTEHQIFEFRNSEIPAVLLKNLFEDYANILTSKKLEFESFTFPISVKHNDTIAEFDLQDFLQLSYSLTAAMTIEEIREVESLLKLEPGEEILISGKTGFQRSLPDSIFYVTRIE